MLCDAGAEVERDLSGYSALMLAALYGSDECVEELIDRGADVFRETGDGTTVLMMAARGGNEECVSQVYLKAEEKKGIFPEYVNKQNKDGMTALMFAARSGNHDCVDYLCREGYDQWEDKDEDEPEVLKVNLYDNNKETALMHAARADNDILSTGVHTITSLLQRGADVNAQNIHDETALIISVKKNNVKMVKTLLRKGSDVNRRNRKGNTAMIIAAKYGLEQLLVLLLQAGADVNIKNKQGMTSLMEATGKGNSACVEFLIKAGADVNASDKGWMTAIMLALTAKSP